MGTLGADLGGKPPLPKFKIAHVTKKYSNAKSGSRHYTLNCERRMAQFKNDFRRLFIGQLDKNNNSFEEHYKHVYDLAAKEMQKDRDRTFALSSQPHNDKEGSRNKFLGYGRSDFMFSDHDVMNMPLLLLDQRNVRDIYGKGKIDEQTVKSMAHND